LPNSKKEGLSAPELRKSIAASVIGNGLEWYDFLLYGFFSPIIANVFFPSDNRLLSFMLTAATFAISFFVRPLGGVVLGVYADRFGRRPVLSAMILIMGLSTVLIGLTPSYAAIGILAPVLIILARVMQGISVGAEFASATAMLIESAPRNSKMLTGSYQMCSQAIAVALASLAGYLPSTLLSPQALHEWGWRMPFLLGAIIAPVGFYIRRFVPESPEFMESTGLRSPIVDVLSQHRKAGIRSLGILIPGVVSNYVWYIFLPVFITARLKLPFTSVMLSTFICGLTLFILIPMIGHWADRWDGRRIWKWGTICFALLAYPFLHYVMAAPSFERLLVVQLVCIVPIAAIWAPSPALLAEVFPTSIRSTGMSIAYNSVVLLFGGLAPLTLTWLIAKTGSELIPAYYVIGSAILALSAIWIAAPQASLASD